MASRLTDHVSSQYFAAANHLRPRWKKTKVIAYVESYDDIAFWRDILGDFETPDLAFEVVLPSRTNLSRGKKSAIMNNLGRSLGTSLIACVDADYDYLMQDSNDFSASMLQNPYVVHTYVYAIENYHCYAPSLHAICTASTLNDRHLFDFEQYLELYSRTIYDLFVWQIWTHRHELASQFSMSTFNNLVEMKKVNMQNPEASLEDLRRRVNRKIAWLQHEFPQAKGKIQPLKDELRALGLTPENTYLYIQGHSLVDNVVLPVLNAACVILRKEREREIAQYACHDTQRQNELASYQHSQIPAEELLNRNTKFRSTSQFHQLYERLKSMMTTLALCWTWILCVGLGVSSCDGNGRSRRNAVVDSLNEAAYRMHYVSLDSTARLAAAALKSSSPGTKGRAEALGNMGFVKYMQMDYEGARRMYEDCYDETDDEATRMMATVGLMKICQVTSQNKEYFDYAMKIKERLNDRGTEEDTNLWNYVCGEYHMAAATFYDVQLQDREARICLRTVRDNMAWVQQDTAQLARLYTLCSSIGQGSSDMGIRMQYLTESYVMARQHGLVYMEACALQKMADMLINDSTAIMSFQPFRHLWDISLVSEDSIGITMARKALDLYKDYGSVYSRGLAYMTISWWYMRQIQPEVALDSALKAAKLALIGEEVPHRSLRPLDWIGKIHEHLSIVYAVLEDKGMSDFHRNAYLDILDDTRQDKQLEERKELLEKDQKRLTGWRSVVSIVCGLIVVGLVLVTILIRRRRKNKRMRIEELRMEEKAVLELRLAQNKRSYIDKCTSLSMVNGIVPFLSRGIKAIHDANVDYAKELFTKINDYNDVLTHWIKIKQGVVKLHVESFPLQMLFDTLANKRSSFEKKGVRLVVNDTTVGIKADKVLTLFMINTLLDNAWKFTDEGQVELKAEEKDDCVEISVTDTGVGMDMSEDSAYKDRKGYGFGLMNCRGIIEKYRKTSRMFDVCRFDVESRKGEGSRFSFRMPKAMLTIVCWLLAVGLNAENRGRLLDMEIPDDPVLAEAHRFADSTFYANVSGEYNRAIEFGDSVLDRLNQYYMRQNPDGSKLMVMKGGRYMPELDWWDAGMVTDYVTILDVRNEIAIAALAIGEVGLYQYNNKVYARLYRLCGQDKGLEKYCEELQATNRDMWWAIVLAVVLVIAGLIAYYVVQRYLFRLASELHNEENKRIEYEDNNLHVQNMILDNCLSTIKHETMYYPSRILNLLSDGNDNLVEAEELAVYYEKIYRTLSEYAMSQLEKVPFKRKTMQFGDFYVLGDEDMLQYLMDQLTDVAKENGGKGKLYFDKSGEFVKFAFEIEGLILDDDETDGIFYPDHLRYDPLRDQLVGMQFIICRQIIREHDDHCGHRGCRIYAENMKNGTRIVFTLPEAKFASTSSV